MKCGIFFRLFTLLACFFMGTISCKESEAYLENRLTKEDKRYETFLLTLNLLKKNEAKVLVETGTARNGADFYWQGGSTVLFADWAKDHQARFYSVDIDLYAAEIANTLTSAYRSNREVICSDSVAYLRTFPQPIDFLYLDSFDFDPKDPDPSQQHHLKEIIAAYPRLHEKSVILIDDCDLPNGGKGKLVIDYLKERGWILLKSAYQVILIKESQLPKEEGGKGIKVFLTILARNKSHLLPYYLKCIENLDYDKSNMIIYINTNNNSDQTEELLIDWMKSQIKNYQTILFEKSDFKIDSTLPHVWNSQRLKILAGIRNNSLKKAKEYGADFYFVIDCDNFIAPFTLKDLIAKDKPIIAPLLKPIPNVDGNDCDSNYFSTVDESGYFLPDATYLEILSGRMRGTFKVPLVHCTYLIKSAYLDALDYSSETGEWEFIVFARKARNQGIDQYICNEKEYGTMIHLPVDITLEGEREAIKELPLSSFMLGSSESTNH